MNAPRPEGLVPADLHYDAGEAQRYHTSSRNIEIQRQLTERCIELLELDKTCPAERPLILDIGCGSGLSSEVLAEHGLAHIGVDLAPDMLAIAQSESPEADLVRLDIGERQNIQSGVFDGAISVSVVQWLCHSFTSAQDPVRRLRQFFDWLYTCLSKCGRAVLQFYPSHQQQIDNIGKAASHAGFSTFFLVDNAESSKRKKVFLIVTVGQPEVDSLIGGTLSGAADKPGTRKGKKTETRKEWVVKKKEKMRQQGREVKADSKYTGRKRKDRI